MCGGAFVFPYNCGVKHEYIQYNCGGCWQLWSSPVEIMPFTVFLAYRGGYTTYHFLIGLTSTVRWLVLGHLHSWNVVCVCIMHLHSWQLHTWQHIQEGVCMYVYVPVWLGFRYSGLL